MPHPEILRDDERDFCPVGPMRALFERADEGRENRDWCIDEAIRFTREPAFQKRGPEFVNYAAARLWSLALPARPREA